ncbi:MAG: transposase [Gammaproteobacteria bacterium]|nr:transposase [Gammaproteobacteria bacterium]MBU1654598.1 transposase [Gammaproteobacteria bacterium]MBU1962326.1 transposase [Gammaproteobacteria bacterium]
MSEYRRARIPGGTFFFTLVTHDRIPYFDSGARVAVLREAFRQVMSSRPFRIEAIVVLPDHLHCLWKLPVGDGDYSSRWREIKKAASRRIATDSNQRKERPVWQRRFWEHAIQDESDWRSHVDYIHYNPVRHGLVQAPGDWPWSSFGMAVRRGWYEPGWGKQHPGNIAGMEVE